MKKFLSRMIALAALFCASQVYAQQPQFWINQSHGIERINLDGTGRVQATARPAANTIGYNQRLLLASDGSVYEVMNDNANPHVTETLYRISSKGVIKIRDFAINTVGNISSLVETADGRICGITSGPSRENGFVFVMTKAGTSYKQSSFTLSNGFLPTGDLLKASNGVIYGQSYGDQYSYIYKIKSNFSGIDVIRQFPLVDEIGLTPINLAEGPDGFLYGLTDGGYTPSVLFKVSLDGQQYTPLLTLEENILPVGKIVFDSQGKIYGEATTGEVFSVNKDGSNFGVFLHFNGPQPSGTLYIVNDILYSNTMYNSPFIFSYDINQNKYKVLHTFPPVSSAIGMKNLLLVTNPTIPDTYLINPPDGSTTANVAATYRAREIKGSLTYTMEISETIDFATVLPAPLYPSPIFSSGVLKYGTKYYARVSCSIWPGYGPITSFTTLTREDYCFISKPIDGAVDVATENLKVTANQIGGATNYTVELSTSSDFSANVWSKSSTVTNQRTMTFSGLPTGTVIYARAKTNVNSYGRVSSFRTLGESAAARSIADVEPTQNTLASPNPFNTNFVVHLNADALTQIVLTDATGRILHNQATIDQSEIYLGDGLAEGVYILKVIEGENVSVQRMSKQ